MKASTALKSMILTVLLVVAGILPACGSSQDTTPASTSPMASNPPDVVQVDYFYEKDACFCLGLATVWINDTINNDYKTQLDSGKLVYKSYNTQDAANAATMQQFDAPKVSFFVTTVRGTVHDTHEVTKLWLYTDSSGKNEVLHAKFLEVLKGELDKALAGN